jgi:hypothetical protein
MDKWNSNGMVLFGNDQKNTNSVSFTVLLNKKSKCIFIQETTAVHIQIKKSEESGKKVTEEVLFIII